MKLRPEASVSALPAPEAASELPAASVISAAAPVVRAKMELAVMFPSVAAPGEVKLTAPSGVVPPHAPLVLIDPPFTVKLPVATAPLLSLNVPLLRKVQTVSPPTVVAVPPVTVASPAVPV